MELIERQKSFFKSGVTKNIKFRIEQLRKFKAMILSYEKEMYDAIYKDFKKSEFETYTTEIALVIHDLDTAIKNVKLWYARKRVKTNLLNFPSKSFIIPEPLGNALVIGAWNYPYQLSLSPIVAAIAAGNTVVLKPSEIPSNTSAVLCKMITETFSDEYLAVIEGGVAETTLLLDQKFDKIFFTGSTQVGKIVYQAAAKNLTPVTLELGGKSPAIVTENANLKIAVRRIVWGKYLNAGQTCIAPDYLLIHTSIKDKFLSLVKCEIEKVKYGIGNDNYVQIINDSNFDRLSEMIDANFVVVGGKTNKKERFIEPTVLFGQDLSSKCMQEEIFGPILPVFQFSDIKEVNAIIEKYDKPLAAYIFTNRKKEREKILSDFSFGGGCVNDAVMHITNGNLPFGGVGGSGFGNYHGEAGFKGFSHEKSIVKRALWPEVNLKYSPYSLRKLKIIKFLFKL